MKCSNCGHELVPGAEFCGNCGAKLVASGSAQPTPPAQTTQQPTQTPPQPPVHPAPTAAPPVSQASNQATAHPEPLKPSKGKSIASMVLGILALVTFLVFFISIPLGILALIFGFLGKGKGGKGMAIAGIVTGSVAIVISLAIFLIAFNHCSKNPDDPSCSSDYSSFVVF